MSCLKKEYKNWNTSTSFSKKLVIDKDVAVNKDIAETLIVYLQKIESTLDQNIRTNIKPFMKNYFTLGQKETTKHAFFK